jgi:hypothetical protein
MAGAPSQMYSRGDEGCGGYPGAGLTLCLRKVPQVSFYKGTNGRWRDILSAEELALYDQAAKRELTLDCRQWLENGRRGLSVGSSPSGGDGTYLINKKRRALKSSRRRGRTRPAPFLRQRRCSNCCAVTGSRKRSMLPPNSVLLIWSRTGRSVARKLAESVGVNSSALFRLLRALAGEGVCSGRRGQLWAITNLSIAPDWRPRLDARRGDSNQ